MLVVDQVNHAIAENKNIDISVLPPEMRVTAIESAAKAHEKHLCKGVKLRPRGCCAASPMLHCHAYTCTAHQTMASKMANPCQRSAAARIYCVVSHCPGKKPWWCFAAILEGGGEVCTVFEFRNGAARAQLPNFGSNSCEENISPWSPLNRNFNFWLAWRGG